MSGQLVLQLLGSVAFVTLITSVVNNLLSRKRLGAEATKIITDAASGVVSDIREDNSRLREREKDLNDRLDALEQAQDAWEDERRVWKQLLREHQSWDTLALSELRKLHPDTEYPPPPPLVPNGT